ncbi:MAG: hypothetical protein ABJC04_11775, partial [Verrucomicrobiota bacterium]
MGHINSVIRFPFSKFNSPLSGFAMLNLPAAKKISKRFGFHSAFRLRLTPHPPKSFPPSENGMGSYPPPE